MRNFLCPFKYNSDMETAKGHTPDSVPLFKKRMHALKRTGAWVQKAFMALGCPALSWVMVLLATWNVGWLTARQRFSGGMLHP